MKILVFTEGILFGHRKWIGLEREEIVKRVREGEEYKDVAERVVPDVVVEDDCESIGGEVEMTYPRIKPEVKNQIYRRERVQRN